MQEQKKFKSTIMWEAEHKLANMEAKTSKTGTSYFLGELNKMFKVVLKENRFKPGQWTLSLVPVKYEVDNGEEAVPQQPQPQTYAPVQSQPQPQQWAKPAPAPQPQVNGWYTNQ